MQQTLVMGANGFVGGYTLNALQQSATTQPIAGCRNESRLPAQFSGKVRIGDIRDPGYLEHVFDNVETLINSAAWSSAWGHKKQSETYFLTPTLKLIQHAADKGVRKIINVSSTSAAAPDSSADPMSPGIKRGRWPHLDNVIEIENRLRELSRDYGVTVINLRFGVFTGQRYGLGMLPILLPRLRTHLVPWVAGGSTRIPITDGEDIGQAIRLAAENDDLTGFQSFNIIGPEQPTVRTLIKYLHDEFAYPKPHFSVPFAIAYPFASLMELLDPIVPWEPLVTRSIIHLLEDTHADNTRAEKLLGYQPEIHWKTSVSRQVQAMHAKQSAAMRMTKPIV